LRKFLVAAVAAVTAIAVAAPIASAQAPATMKVSVTPTKAGTKSKPKNSTINLSVRNADTKRTMSKLAITTAKTFKLSTKGLTRCKASVLETRGASACPKASRVGKGTAEALVGVNGTSPTPLTFKVTAVVTGAKNLAFDLVGQQLPIHVMAPGTISGNKLTISVPQAAQQPAPNVFAGLVSLQATMTGKKGTNYLASTTGCVKKRHPFSSLLTFINNGVSPAGTVTAKANARCSK
jgi:hypothetical protein